MSSGESTKEAKGFSHLDPFLDEFIRVHDMSIRRDLKS